MSSTSGVVAMFNFFKRVSFESLVPGIDGYLSLSFIITKDSAHRSQVLGIQQAEQGHYIRVRNEW